jgi:hypothetical protein
MPRHRHVSVQKKEQRVIFHLKANKILHSGRGSASLFNVDPDPAFHLNADPDTASLQSDGNLRPLI